MSHSVTITRTTTTTSGSTMFVNTGYLKTFPGLLKLAQLLLGAACVGLAAHYYDSYYWRNGTSLGRALLFFFLMAVAFLIGTFCLLLSCLISLSTSSLVSKTIYESIYHSLAFILYLAASLTLIIEVNHRGNNNNSYEPILAASIVGLVVSVLYLISAFLASRTYRGI